MYKNVYFIIDRILKKKTRNYKKILLAKIIIKKLNHLHKSSHKTGEKRLFLIFLSSNSVGGILGI